MGWTDSHLHHVEKDRTYWGVPEYDDVIDESKVQLAELLHAERESMRYVYDFGDNWRHEVMLEKIMPTDDAVKVAICLDGARRCPPEDVGGTSGYQECLQVIFDPSDEEHEHLIAWAGGPFQPEEFNLKSVNEKLSRMRLPIRHRR
jgi:Plasmid pRiA4b ORF-3-like protein